MKVPPGVNPSGMFEYIIEESGLSFAEIMEIFQREEYQLDDYDELRICLSAALAHLPDDYITIAEIWLSTIETPYRIEMLHVGKWQDLYNLLVYIASPNEIIQRWEKQAFKYGFLSCFEE